MNCYTIYKNRDIKIYLIIFIFILFPVNAVSHPQDYKKFKNIEMEVLKDGRVIGFSKYYFDYNNQILQVRNETEFEVKLLGVKVFSIYSEGIEKYNNNNLIFYNSKTLQNKKNKFVNLKLNENGEEFLINGSSYSGKASLLNIIGNWWNHDILEANSQISPLSGSIKKQKVIFIGEEVIEFQNIKYNTKRYKLISKYPDTPDNKKLDFDLWYNKNENLILKITYNKMGNWEYRVKSIVKN